MRVRIQDSNGDFTFGQSSLNYYVNIPAAVAQVCQTSLLLFQGEWFLDNTLGVPYFQGVLGINSQAQADQTIMAAITGVQGVVSLVNYKSTLDPQTRAYQVVSATINTIYGQTQLNIQNLRDF